MSEFTDAAALCDPPRLLRGPALSEISRRAYLADAVLHSCATQAQIRSRMKLRASHDAPENCRRNRAPARCSVAVSDRTCVALIVSLQTLIRAL